MPVSTRIAHEYVPSERSNWIEVLDRAIAAAEAAEMDLSGYGGSDPATQRKASGSYYTPADVADHFWTLFFRHHHIHDLSSLLTFIATSNLVEPSAGSGIFVFSFLRKAASLGAAPENLAPLRFHVVDINLAALRFFSERMHDIEAATGMRFEGIGPSQNDFLQWTASTSVSNAVFVGNPPFIANPRGHRWRNLYADFVEAMLDYGSKAGISLILPISVCFSRDYADLRNKIRSACMGISASNYDNIPDCLFKAGKPDSTNSNRANSQRCTILHIGGPDPTLREASPLLRWSASERGTFLSGVPTFHPFSDDDPSGQIPRPASFLLTRYMNGDGSGRPLRSLLSKTARPAFALGGVARNYIGIRDFDAKIQGTIPIRSSSEEDSHILLQIFSSRLFHDYWQTYGDGFHVTVDLVERFVVRDDWMNQLRRKSFCAKEVWENRALYAKEKLNSGRVIRSYDFRSAFEE